MKHMTLSEFIDSESDEPVFIVDGPQPIVGTGSIETASAWHRHRLASRAFWEHATFLTDADN